MQKVLWLYDWENKMALGVREKNSLHIINFLHRRLAHFCMCVCIILLVWLLSNSFAVQFFITFCNFQTPARIWHTYISSHCKSALAFWRDLKKKQKFLSSSSLAVGLSQQTLFYTALNHTLMQSERKYLCDFFIFFRECVCKMRMMMFRVIYCFIIMNFDIEN